MNKWQFPKSVKQFCYHHNAFIVGSTADPDCKQPRDIDVVIPFAEWNQACGLIPNTAVKNSFGGWRFLDGGQTVEVWPDDLGHYMRSDWVEWVWQPRYNFRFRRDER